MINSACSVVVMPRQALLKSCKEVSSQTGRNSGIQEQTYHTMELAPLIPLRLPPSILTLPRTKLTEVLCSLRHHVLEQFHLDPSQLLTYHLVSGSYFANLSLQPLPEHCSLETFQMDASHIVNMGGGIN
jgi:hypothetical protein